MLLASPRKLLQHWWDVARSFWIDPDLLLLDTPFRLFGQAGLLFTLLAGRRIPSKQRGLLALYVGGLLASLALIRYDPRFLILLLPILAFCVAYAFLSIIPERIQISQVRLPLSAFLLALLCLWGTGNPVHALNNGPKSDGRIIEVSNTLRAGGMRDTNQVLSTAIPVHDMITPERFRYPQSYWVAPDVDSPEALLNLAKERGFRYVVYDAATGKNVHPGLASLLDTSTRIDGLTLMWISDSHSLSVHRIESGTAPVPGTAARFGDDILLQGHDLSLAEDAPEGGPSRVGLFLYWRASAPIRQSYKVFVHITGEDGNLIAQDDGVPVLWTHPTDRWQADSLVVDFHSISLPEGMMDSTASVLVGLYPEAEPERRLDVVDQAGTVSDRLLLETLTLGER